MPENLLSLVSLPYQLPGPGKVLLTQIRGQPLRAGTYIGYCEGHSELLSTASTIVHPASAQCTLFPFRITKILHLFRHCKIFEKWFFKVLSSNSAALGHVAFTLHSSPLISQRSQGSLEFPIICFMVTGLMILLLMRSYSHFLLSTCFGASPSQTQKVQLSVSLLCLP